MTDISTVSHIATDGNSSQEAVTAAIAEQKPQASSEKVDSDYLERFERLARREREMQKQHSKLKEVETRAEKLARLEQRSL